MAKKNPKTQKPESPVETQAEAQTESTPIEAAPESQPEAPIEDPVADSEKAYGEETLANLLAQGIEAFSAADLEPSVKEAIFRKLITGKVSSLPKAPLSTAQSPCKLVWAIASSMPGVKREVVLAECVAQGVALNTAKTQYQHWKKAGEAKPFTLPAKA